MSRPLFPRRWCGASPDPSRAGARKVFVAVVMVFAVVLAGCGAPGEVLAALWTCVVLEVAGLTAAALSARPPALPAWRG